MLAHVSPEFSRSKERVIPLLCKAPGRTRPCPQLVKRAHCIEFQHTEIETAQDLNLHRDRRNTER